MTYRKTKSTGAVLAAVTVAVLMAAPPAEAGLAFDGRRCLNQCHLLDEDLNVHCFYQKGKCLTSAAPVCPRTIEEGYAEYESCGIGFNDSDWNEGYHFLPLWPPQP